MLIVIGLCTYKRVQMIEETLRSLSKVFIPKNTEVVLVVIDNDSKKSSESIVKKFEDSLEMKIDYTVESKRGIVYARNKALEVAEQYDPNYMFFIDDDEIVDLNWLYIHLSYIIETEVDVVSGPVYTLYPSETPNWVKIGGFFEFQQDIEEGSIVLSSATGNVSFDFQKLYHQFGLRFDESLKSREDNDFFMAASNQGAVIKWTNKAIVNETIPLSKMNTKWLLQRVYKGGEAFTARTIKYQGKTKALVMILSRVIYRIFLGLILFPIAIIKGYAYIVKSLQQFSIIFGMIGGLFGNNYDDYKQIHGY